MLESWRVWIGCFLFIQTDVDLASSLQGVAKTLERQMIHDAVSKQLHDRPDVGELRDVGVLKSDGVASRCT